METETKPSSSKMKLGAVLLMVLVFLLVILTLNGAQKSQSTRSKAAELPITPNPLLQTVGLDSTIRANWPAPTAAYSKQIFSVWDGDTLVATKLLGNTANVADANGLQGDHEYTIKIEGLTASGQKELYMATNASTQLQPQMTNSAFFENFMDTSPMEVKSDYLDVRTLANEGVQPDTLRDERMMYMPNERHFHTEMLGGVQRSELTVRPRVPFDFTGRTGTFQVEVDMAPVQNDNQGVWWEIHLTKEIPGSGRALGSGGGTEFQNGITFSIARPQNQTGADHNVITNTNMNRPLISVNINESNPDNVPQFEGTMRQATGVNIRMPVVLKIVDDPTHSPRNKAEMWVNGSKVDETPWMNFGFSKGFWTIAHRHFYTSRNLDFQIPNQLVHWDTISYDGQSGSFSPYMKTYIQPNCAKVVNYDIHSYQNGGIRNCAKLSFTGGTSTVPFTIDQADFNKGIRGGRLIFSVTKNQAQSYSGNINGVAFTQPYFDNSEYEPDPATILIRHDLTQAEIASLHTGANQIVFNGSNNITISQVELEVEFNQPRVIANPATTNPPVMLGASSNSFRIHHDPNNPNAQETVTTTLFSSGAAGSVGWHADVFMDTNDHDIDGNNVNDWLRISSTDGTLQNSPANIGAAGLTNLTITADFTRLRTDCTTTACTSRMPENDGKDGTVGVIRIRRADDPMMMNHMPVYISVMVVNDGRTTAQDLDDHFLTTFTGLSTTFNKCAIPNYCISPTPINDTPTPPQPTPTVDSRRADIDHSGTVTVQDFNLLKQHYNHTCTPGTTQCADIDCNGIINTLDYGLLQKQLGRPVPTQAPLCPYLIVPSAPFGQQNGKR